MLFIFCFFSVKVWDIEAFAPEISYDLAHSGYVTCVRFHGATNETNDSGAVFVSAALDGRCLLWDRRQKFPARGKVYCNDLKPIIQKDLVFLIIDKSVLLQCYAKKRTPDSSL